MTDTTPHRATAEQWAAVEKCAKYCVYDACILELRARIEALECRDREDSDAWTGVRRANSELRARIEALEADATCPHVVSSDEGTSYCGLAEQQVRIGQSDVPANTSAFELSDEDPIPQRPAPPVLLVVPPLNCTQRLLHEGKPYPKSSCEACGSLSPMWRQCEAAMKVTANPSATPAESLVERVCNAWSDGSHTKGDLARAAICAVAEWLRDERHSVADADALEREARR